MHSLIHEYICDLLLVSFALLSRQLLAFTAIASIEGVNKIVTGKLISLSEQELLDCYQKNCDPGNTNEAFEFIIKNGGIDTEEDYPYKSHYVGCNLNKV